MIDIVYLIKDLFDCKFNLHNWINNRYTGLLCDPRYNVAGIVTKEGLIFIGCVYEVLTVVSEVSFDITSEDVVLDLGANVGGFAIRAAKKAKHVYAVEPVWTEELKENVKRNGMQDKITIIPYAIGDGCLIKLNYAGRIRTAETIPFGELLKKIPDKITFLKVDIEGAEWGINPKDLDGIKRIEFEAHEFVPVNKHVLNYIREHWNTIETKLHKRTMIHAREK